jgi:hypothetical protein
MPTKLARGRRGAIALALSVLTAAATASVTTPAVSAVRTSAARTSAARTSAARTWSVRVRRGGPARTIVFGRARAGEAFLNATVSAKGVSWAETENESAVVSAYVDGHYATDIVITSSGPVTRQFALGHLKAGRHTLRLHYAAHRSPSRAGIARLRDIGVVTVPPTSAAYAAARFAPVLYGRDVTITGARGRPFQNNRTDAPLIAWHQVSPAADPGHSWIEYSVLWSNEDGGTSTPGLMAQWGRTTDIEWVYRVEVDAHGHRVPGTGVIQGAAHQTVPFKGRYDGTHPLIQTCTSNNDVCAKIDDPMRFALSTRAVLPVDQPREHEMDIHPWTYQVMAREMLREHKIESPSDPATFAVGDQRSYLYIALDHDTVPPASAALLGLEVDVRLKGDRTTYTSDHGIAFFSVNRDGPAATTVELPLGTRPRDIASISVVRTPIGTTDNGGTLTVTDVERAFFLGTSYRPKPSFLSWHGSKVLTQTSPTAQLWPTS